MSEMTYKKAKEILSIFKRSTCPTPGGLSMHCSEHNSELGELLNRPQWGEESEVSLHSRAIGVVEGYEARTAQVESLNAPLKALVKAVKEFVAMDNTVVSVEEIQARFSAMEEALKPFLSGEEEK